SSSAPGSERARARHIAGEFHALDLVAHRVTGHDEPAVTAGGVIPEFAMEAAHIVAQIEEIGEGLRRAGGAGIRTHDRRSAEISELLVAAFATEWAGNPHVVLNAGWAGRPGPSRRSLRRRRSGRGGRPRSARAGLRERSGAQTPSRRRASRISRLISSRR